MDGTAEKRKVKSEKRKTKEKIRHNILSKRNKLSQTDVKSCSRNIFRRLAAIREFKNARTIMFYVSKDNEVATMPIIKYAIKHKKNVCVPNIDIKKRVLHPVSIKNPENDLHRGHFGILEPLFNINKIVSLKKIDLIIIPGIAFDLSGHRLGWGKGYYDRFLEKAKENHKIGLVFDFQIVKELPKDRHDVPVDIVVTEKMVIKIGGCL